MKSSNTKRILHTVLVFSTTFLSIILLIMQSMKSDWHDFDVFYHAASAAMTGKSMYIIVGRYNLPFWYLPWTAWFYIPYAIWPKQIGLMLYQATSIISISMVVNYLTKYYQLDFDFKNKILILAFLVPMSLQLIMVGQMDYILLGLLVIIIWAVENKKDVLVGVLYPFLLTKPHLIVPFTIYLFLRSGKRAILISGFLSVAMLLLETLLQTGWYLEMLRLLQTSGKRIDGLPFTTFPSLLGSQENWVGTANLPFTVILFLVSILILWRFRSLPTIPFFSFALAASLFSAQRAYAYDLPLLVPAMIWVTIKDGKFKWWLWGIISIFSIFSISSPSTYLITLLVFGLSIYKAYKSESEINKSQTKAVPPQVTGV